MKYAWGIREWKSTLRLIRLMKRREAQFHINVLLSSYAGWSNSTRPIITRQQELLFKYNAKACANNGGHACPQPILCTVGFTEAFDKTQLNRARILDKRRVQSSYCFTLHGFC